MSKMAWDAVSRFASSERVDAACSAAKICHVSRIFLLDYCDRNSRENAKFGISETNSLHTERS